ncbi:SRPBCC domain-containing protein [Mucilaginibacter sp. PAMB04274]|uniref:SRPBCC family protein n=1 Tax=Mucilaginibacter sp. PAMB04274 TaxID=3138568 RepID=UPI0031F66F74
MERDIIVTWYFEQSPAQVWQCLTQPELLSQWFMKNDFKAEVGHQFTFISKPIRAVNWDGIVYCEVLESTPEHKLVYTWKGGPKPGIINLDTILTWTLTPQNGGTLLRLEHKGFKGIKNYLSSFMMEKGWGKVLRRFQQTLKDYSNV